MPFIKGQSGNPTGRPVSKPLTDLIRKLGTEGGYERVITALYQRAYDGDVNACREILNRVEGKISDKMILESSVDLGELLARRAAENHGKRVEAEGGDTTDGTTE